MTYTSQSRRCRKRVKWSSRGRLSLSLCLMVNEWKLANCSAMAIRFRNWKKEREREREMMMECLVGRHWLSGFGSFSFWSLEWKKNAKKKIIITIEIIVIFNKNKWGWRKIMNQKTCYCNNCNKKCLKNLELVEFKRN